MDATLKVEWERQHRIYRETGHFPIQNCYYGPESFTSHLEAPEGNLEPYFIIAIHAVFRRRWMKNAALTSFSHLWEDISKQLQGNHKAGVRLRKMTLEAEKIAKAARKPSLANREARQMISFKPVSERWAGDMSLEKSSDFARSEGDRHKMCFEKMNDKCDWRSRAYHKPKALLTQLGNDLNAACAEAAEAAWKTYQYEGRLNKAAAQRFRTKTLEIEKLCAAVRKESLRVMRVFQSQAFQAQEYPVGALVSWTYEKWVRTPGKPYWDGKFKTITRTGTIAGHSEGGNIDVVMAGDRDTKTLPFYDLVLLEKNTDQASTRTEHKAVQKVV